MVPNFLIVSLSFKGTHGMSQNFIVLSLTTPRWTNEHETMSNLNRVVKLDNLVEEGKYWLKFVFSAGFFNLNHQITVVDFRLFYSWEQILDDILK